MVMQALWGNTLTTDVWGCSKVVFQKCRNDGNDFMSLAEGILARCGKEDLKLFIYLARQI